MSELMNVENMRSDFRWHLLATVSALALIGAVMPDMSALADEPDRPTVWIELGGQLERMEGSEQPFAPPFVTANLNNAYNAQSPLSVERRSRYSFGGEGKITFEPEGTDWTFSAGIRYGRSNRAKHLHQQTSTKIVGYALYIGSTVLTRYGLEHPYFTATRFSDVQSKRSESHAILDFMAGKDVGLGLFGRHSTSSFNAGVRYAQFNAKATTTFHSRPVAYYYPILKYKSHSYHLSYYARSTLSRSFHGIGPALSWANSSPVLGNPQAGEVTVDWGINAALLFGRQKVSGSHQTTGRHFYGTSRYSGGNPTIHYVHTAPPINRSRSATVPNLGGFAGFSFNFPNAKVSMGYRADFFFGAMDGGVDRHKAYDRNFYGPYLMIGLGL